MVKRLLCALCRSTASDRRSELAWAHVSASGADEPSCADGPLARATTATAATARTAAQRAKDLGAKQVLKYLESKGGTLEQVAKPLSGGANA